MTDRCTAEGSILLPVLATLLAKMKENNLLVARDEPVGRAKYRYFLPGSDEVTDQDDRKLALPEQAHGEPLKEDP